MTREEKREYLLKQFTKNTLSIYLDGFEDGFDCTYDAVKKDFEEELKAKDEEIEKLKSIIEEAIRKPMGVEPYSWSDYKIQKDNA